MIEKGRGVMEIFKMHEIDMKPKELAKSIQRIQKKSTKERVTVTLDQKDFVFLSLHSRIKIGFIDEIKQKQVK